MFRANTISAIVFFALTASPAVCAQDLVAAVPGKFAAGIELPAGDNRALVLQACTMCHDLKGVPAYKGYWNRQQWQAMVNTMVQHGARLDASEATQVVDYLTEYFGKK